MFIIEVNLPMMEYKTPLILFDGVCNLCSNSVQFVIRHDKKKQFNFASLQGETGQQILRTLELPAQKFSSFILIEEDNFYTESTGVLRLLKRLGGMWSLLYIFIVVPPFIRNAAYRFISVNRYRWFGKTESCMLPTPELRARFLP